MHVKTTDPHLGMVMKLCRRPIFQSVLMFEMRITGLNSMTNIIAGNLVSNHDCLFWTECAIQ